MKKINLGLATLAASLAITPAVFAAEQFGTVTYVPKLDSCAADPSNNPTIDPEDGKAAEVDVTFSKLCLVYQPQQEAVPGHSNERQEAAYIGFKMTAPSEDLANTAKITFLETGAQFNYKDSLDEGQDNKTVVSVWKSLTAKTLAEYTSAGEKTHTFTYVFDWNGDGSDAEHKADDQTVNVIINTEEITLQDIQQETVFTPEDAKDNIAAYEASQNQPTTTDDGNENPNTADPIALYATIAVLAVLGLGASVVIAKKSNR